MCGLVTGCLAVVFCHSHKLLSEHSPWGWSIEFSGLHHVCSGSHPVARSKIGLSFNLLQLHFESLEGITCDFCYLGLEILATWYIPGTSLPLSQSGFTGYCDRGIPRCLSPDVSWSLAARSRWSLLPSQRSSRPRWMDAWLEKMKSSKKRWWPAKERKRPL
jgi:hypothetical protein